MMHDALPVDLDPELVELVDAAAALCAVDEWTWTCYAGPTPHTLGSRTDCRICRIARALEPYR